mgnify:FL=1
MPVFLLLILLLVTAPLVELYVLIAVGREIGAGPTIGLAILTAVIGAWLLRWQGLNTLNRVQQSLQAGELPAVELVEGVILLLTGVMLLTPGFITDAIGFLCLVPVIRRYFAAGLAGRLVVSTLHGVRGHHRGPGSNEDYTIDGEFTVDDEDRRRHQKRLD